MKSDRRTIVAGLSIACGSLLTSCGTIIYPDRANQKHRGQLDPAVVILDAVGLIFFLIPGIVAFAVDFGTGAIYFPEGHEPGDKERTIFDRVDAGTKPSKLEIEQAVASRIGIPIDLGANNVVAVRMGHLREFSRTYAGLSRTAMFASID